jgi:aspartate carbamoyltransferase catalytic subunit
MLRLGGQVISVADALHTSSAWKGETLKDTILTIQSYAHAIAIRHAANGTADEAARYSNVPILNAGDGTNEHPTQALLDLLTIRRVRGTIDGLHITMVGDLKHTRTIPSLIYGLSNFDVRVAFVSPSGFEPIEPVQQRLRERGIPFGVGTDVRQAVRETDVLYVTRVQKERLASPEEAERIIGAYSVDMSVVSEGTRQPLVMHHLPRVGELSEDVDAYPGAVYFKQPWNGVLTRMALLTLLLNRAW